MKKLFTGLCILLTISAFGQNNAQEDQLLQTIQKELDRNMKQLKEQPVPAYLLSYRVEETERYSISASSGVIESSRKNKERILTVLVRVGDKRMDNTREIRGGREYDFEGMAFSSVRLSLDDDSKSIVQALWRETEKAYKDAVKKYTKVKTSTSLSVDAEDQSDDYSDIVPEQYYEKPLLFSDFNFNVPQWEQKLKNYTQVFAKEKDILEGSASVSFSVVRKYFVSSEGSSIVQNATAARLFLDAKIQADDGMKMPLYKSYFAFTFDKLPNDAAVMDEVNRMKTRLIALKNAPVVDAFTGPAILSNEAAGVFFHEIFGHRVESYRMKKETDAQTFKKKMNQPVLHTDITVIFDPTIKEYKGNYLNGSYVYDDEGVKGEKVVAIENGVLKDFLTTRKPIEGFAKSNGHARAAEGYQPVSRQSNLIVETSHPYTDVQLREMLIAEAKKQGKEYGYLFGSVRGGFTLVGRYVPNSFNVMPLEVYRIYVDGRPDELVRGVDLVGTPLAMFSQIEGVGDTHGNFAGTCGAESGGIPAGCCSPALFVKMIETQRKSKNQDLAQLLEKPYKEQETQNADFETIAFKAMGDEMQRNVSQLKIDSLEKLYYISYLISDAYSTTIESALGGIIQSKTNPVRNLQTSVLVGNNQRNNLNFGDAMMFFGENSGNSVPIENDYNALCRELWNATDDAYKDAARTYIAKNAAIERQNLPQKDLDLPDFSSIPVQTVKIDSKREEIDVKKLEKLAKGLSNIFIDYPDFTQSLVTFSVYQADVYYLNSEGVKYKQPYNLVSLKALATTLAADGEPLQDEYALYVNTLEQLPSEAELKKRITEMASLLNQLRTAPVVDDMYNGAVLFEGEAVAEIVSQAFFAGSDGLIAKRKPIEDKSETMAFFSAILGSGDSKGNKYDALIGKPIISKNLSIKAIDRTRSFEDIPLIGSYEVDAEGVSVKEETPLVVNGVLQTLLSDRIPTHGLAQSNGHKRLVLTDGLQPKLAPGVIEMTAKQTVSADKMKKQLIDMAKKKGFEYAYIVRKIGSPSLIDNDVESITASVMSMMSGKKPAEKAVYVYRVSVKDGTETLVRTTSVSSISIDSFEEVLAVSDKKQAWNIPVIAKGGMVGFLISTAGGGGVTASFIVPQGLLLPSVEVEKQGSVSLQKPPVTPNPLK
ncbi:MAG: metallopeptidase TldD-related protein [Lentimicrobiaceae bacterium]|nr:metallopeptidase TldD-related protein [Lentimicrobiaceae bacterium]